MSNIINYLEREIVLSRTRSFPGELSACRQKSGAETANNGLIVDTYFSASWKATAASAVNSRKVKLSCI